MPNFGNEASVAGTHVWLTPKYIIDALGPFDLDPCAATDRPYDTAQNHYTVEDDGFSRDWFGRVWCNPPYGPELDRWLGKLSDHGDGIALVFARTETKAFFRNVWQSPTASAILFMRGRVKFLNKYGAQGGTAGSPSCLIAYGERNVEALRRCGLPGVVVQLGGSQEVIQ